jgi:glutamate dehydrogenase (NADP+)
VAEHTARKLQAEGAVVLTLSDRSGYVYAPDGLSDEAITAVMVHKHQGQALETFVYPGVSIMPGTPWQQVVAEGYFPCATQNEISAADARVIAAHATVVVEGANMPLSNEAIRVLGAAHIMHAPGKASNAGGVAVSGLEMVQNASHYPWSRARVEAELQAIMTNIHSLVVAEGKTDWGVDYVRGANIAGAKRVLAAMEKLGW